jgi:hypothetical protein
VIVRKCLVALFLLVPAAAFGQPGQAGRPPGHTPPLQGSHATPPQDGHTSPPEVQVTSSVDRTAIWVADRVTYSINLVCAPGVDVLLDDLAKEKIRLNGLEFVSTDETQTTDAAGRTTHRLRYVLTTFRVDVTSLTIEPVSARYYVRKPGQRLQDVAPAGDVRIPGAGIAFRSTLPDGQAEYRLRDARQAAPRQWLFARTRQFGIAAVILSLAPAAFLLAGAVRRRNAAVAARPSKRQIRVDHRAALERLRSMDVETEEDRRRAYDEISGAVRAHVAARAHVPAAALTAEELEHALESARGRIQRETVTSLLSTCDTARYAPPQAIPSAEQCRDALRTAEHLLEA